MTENVKRNLCDNFSWSLLWSRGIAAFAFSSCHAAMLYSMFVLHAVSSLFYFIFFGRMLDWICAFCFSFLFCEYLCKVYVVYDRIKSNHYSSSVIIFPTWDSQLLRKKSIPAHTFHLCINLLNFFFYLFTKSIQRWKVSARIEFFFMGLDFWGIWFLAPQERQSNRCACFLQYNMRWAKFRIKTDLNNHLQSNAVVN